MLARLKVIACSALVLAFAGSAAANADPVRIRIAWVVAPPSLSPILFAPPGVARHLGKSYTFEPIYISATPQHITAIAAGELEVAALNFATLPLAVENAGLTDLRIVFDELQDGHDGYYTAQYMVRNDSGITKPEDLKGKVLAVNGIGTGVDMAMRAYLIPRGLHYPGDYTIVEVPFPNMNAMLGDRKVDLITAAVPFVYAPTLQQTAHTLFTMKDGLGGAELSFWVMREGFIKAHRAAVVDMIEDASRAYRWYYDPKNHDAAIEILSKFLKRPPAQLQWAFTKKDSYRSTAGVVDLPELQRNVDTVYKLGFIKKPLKVADYADLSLVKEADARIK
jgi:NitT/TauT family transport system substrate-binding protein